MSTIMTTDDLLAAARDNQEFREAFRREYAIDATRRAAPDIAGRFGPALQVSGLLPTVLTANDLTELIKAHRQNAQRLDLSDAQWQSFISPDVIIRVEALFPKDPDAAPFYLSVQSSYTVDDDDVRRAVEHAGVLRALTGRRAYAVVSGTQLLERMRNQPTENAREVVGDDALTTALWFQLPDSSIEPPEPC